MININKGMPDGAEAIQSNFQEVKMQSGSNANGNWFQFGNFMKVSTGDLVFTKPGGYVVGDEIQFAVPLPIDYDDYHVFLQPTAYNATVGGFSMYDLEVHLVNKWAGAITVRRVDTNTTSITLQYLLVGA